MGFKENFLTVKHMIKKLVCNPKQALHYLNPYKIGRAFHYLNHDGLKSVSRILDDRLLMGSDLKLQIETEPLITGKTTSDFPQIFLKEQGSPTVSIIIPVYNQFAYTYNCLRSIFRYSGEISYEVLLADDCSDDLTENVKDIIKGIRVIRTADNLKFLKNCNQAAKQARGKYLLFLNNDTQVQKNWLAPLVELMEKHPEAGLTGSKLVYPDGSLQECGGILWKDGSAWNYGHGRNPALPEFCYVKECDYISGASIMIRRDLWDRLGGFDESFAPAYYEDSDLAFRVRASGFKVMVQPESVVVHFEGKSNGTDVNEGIKAYQIKNAETFHKKWENVLTRENLENGKDVFLARDRSQLKKKILIIDHKVPMYDNDAGARMVFMYVKLYLEAGFSVTFLPDNFFPNQPYTRELEKMGVEVLYGNYYFSYHDQWVRENAGYFDYYLLNRPHISVKYIDEIIENRKQNSTLIYLGHDLHFLREKRQYEISGKKEDLESSEKWKKIETELIKKADISWFFGNYEKEYLQKEFPEKIFRTIPIFIYEPLQNAELSNFESRKNLLFVGGFNHPPNIDAVLWFAKEVFPEIKKSIPEIEWNIAGSNPTEEVTALDGKDIHILGFVSDKRLKQLYDETRLVVVPLRFGAGVKGKVVEAVYSQAPMITTPIGAEGISTEEGAFAVAEANAQTLAREVIELYNDKKRLCDMVRASRPFINNHYTEKQAMQAIQQDFR